MLHPILQTIQKVVWVEQDQETMVASTVTRPKPNRKRVGDDAKICKEPEETTEFTSRVKRGIKRSMGKFSARANPKIDLVCYSYK